MEFKKQCQFCSFYTHTHSFITFGKCQKGLDDVLFHGNSEIQRNSQKGTAWIDHVILLYARKVYVDSTNTYG